MKKILLFIFISIVLSDTQFNYKIKFFGIGVANCNVIYSDTVLYNKHLKKIEYKVLTNDFINNFFKVDNKYMIILDEHYNTVYYKKDTLQPKLKNQIETEYSNGSLRYKNSNIIINKNNVNIFSVLYMIYNQDFDALSKVTIVEREGKYYNFNSNIYEMIN